MLTSLKSSISGLDAKVANVRSALETKVVNARAVSVIKVVATRAVLKSEGLNRAHNLEPCASMLEPYSQYIVNARAVLYH